MEPSDGAGTVDPVVDSFPVYGTVGHGGGAGGVNGTWTASVSGVGGTLTPGAAADGVNFARGGGAAGLAPPGIRGGEGFEILAFVLTFVGVGLCT